MTLCARIPRSGALGQLLQRLKVGARVCVLTHALAGIQGLRCVAVVRELRVSWGDCIGRVYERVEEQEELSE